MSTKEVGNINEIYISTAGFNTKFDPVYWTKTWNLNYDEETKTVSSINPKEDNEMTEEKLNKFIEENNVEVDGDNLTLYLTTEKDNDEFEVGTVYQNTDLMVGTLETEMNGLMNEIYSGEMKPSEWLKNTTEKIFKVKVNKKDVMFINDDDNLNVSKIKILEEVEIKPIIEYKIEQIGEKSIQVKVYNKYTKKSRYFWIDYSLEENAIKGYIKQKIDQLDKEWELLKRLNGSEIIL